ncbi:MAG: glycosyltransferase family 4 protein [Acidobacteriota bacterium]
MNHLIFKEIPPVIEREKNSNAKQVSITGSAVAQTDLVKALLQYGSYSGYYFLWPWLDSIDEARRQLRESYPNTERTQVIGLDDFTELQRLERMIIFTGTSLIDEASYLRKCFGRNDWPVVGITHALSYLEGIHHVQMMLLGDLNSYDCLICTSRAGQKALQNIFAELSLAFIREIKIPISFKGRLPVIPLAIDESYFQIKNREEARQLLGISNDAIVFLYLGRLSASFKMDPIPLIWLFSQVIINKRNKVRLILAGNDTLLDTTSQIRELTSSLGIADKIIVMPNINREEKASLYTAADVFVSLSDNVQETFGLTIIEAMAAGLPVIASDWSGYRESIEHGKTGFLVPTHWGPFDDKQLSLAAPIRGNITTHQLLSQSVCIDLAVLEDYIMAVCDNVELRRKLGEAGRQRARQYYTWASVISQYEALWMELLEESASSSIEKVSSDINYQVCSYDYLKIFHHYATGAIDNNTRLQITNLGHQLLEQPLHLASFQRVFTEIDKMILNEIVIAYKQNKNIELSKLIGNIAQGQTVALTAIQRSITKLLKYGLLTFSPTHIE